MNDIRIRQILAEVERLHADLRDCTVSTDGIHPAHQLSARNLAHFLTLRSRDRRALQDGLAELGLSSLGRCESHVLSTVAAVHRALAGLLGDRESAPPPPSTEEAPGYVTGRMLLERKTQDLLGPPPSSRWTRIMVTLPTEAATDPTLVGQFVAAGMDVARINCAHDDELAWEQMAHHVRAAAAEAGRPVRIVMDLAGPKLRTTEIPDGPPVRKLRPTRDVLGRVIAPSVATLVATWSDDPDSGPVPDGSMVPVDAELLDGLTVGATLDVLDARGAHRSLDVVEVASGRAAVELRKTTYFTTGSIIERSDGVTSLVGRLPRATGEMILRVDDELWLMAEGADAPPTPSGHPPCPRVGCTLPEALQAALPGQRIFFDDGKIGGVVAATTPGGVLVRITRASSTGSKLRAEKGVNLPDTQIPVPALTSTDRRALDTVVRLADAVSLSFVRRPEDVVELQALLSDLGADDLGIVLKIETLGAFQHLPELVTAAMASERVGVMIARGDLAVEVGYERLAEVQEEVLWLCEAAHLPVIWATQVLDTLARTGQPSRAEITDAAMSERADGVMLNKGPHIPLAIATLDDILHRMAGHQSKKRPLLRPLRSWIRG